MMVTNACAIANDLAAILKGYISPYPSKHPVFIEK